MLPIDVLKFFIQSLHIVGYQMNGEKGEGKMMMMMTSLFG